MAISGINEGVLKCQPQSIYTMPNLLLFVAVPYAAVNEPGNVALLNTVA